MSRGIIVVIYDFTQIILIGADHHKIKTTIGVRQQIFCFIIS